MSEELLEEQLTTRYNHLNLLKELSGIETQHLEDEQAILGAESAVTVAKTSLEDAKIQYNKIEVGFIEDARIQMEEAQKEIAEFKERQKELEDNLFRTTITSPIKGIVNKLYKNTTGGVINPGEILLDIVPTDENLIIEAELPIKDIGFVSINQRAVVKLDSPDAPIFGNIEGIEEYIESLPDTDELFPDFESLPHIDIYRSDGKAYKKIYKHGAYGPPSEIILYNEKIKIFEKCSVKYSILFVIASILAFK